MPLKGHKRFQRKNIFQDVILCAERTEASSHCRIGCNWGGEKKNLFPRGLISGQLSGSSGWNNQRVRSWCGGSAGSSLQLLCFTWSQSCAKCTRAKRRERQRSRIGKDLNYSFGRVTGRTRHLWHLWSLRAAFHPRAQRGEGPWLSWSCLVLTAGCVGRGRGGFVSQERGGCALYTTNKEGNTMGWRELVGQQDKTQELQGVQ